MFGRPEISGNDRFHAGGCRFEVSKPFEALQVRYEGKLVYLDKPEEMADPRKAFRENPWVEASVDLDYRGLARIGI